MHPEIENLIEMALADGIVTEKERAIILRKATSLNEDVDEVEMILDGKIAIMEKEKNAAQVIPPPIKSNKEGDIKKCPSCGSPVISFQTHCPDCGHEFRSIKAEKTISDLFNLLTQIQNEKYNKNDMDEERHNFDKQENAISMFPVPNSKEAILEFLAQSLPKAKGHGSRWANIMNENGFDTQIRKAWKNKFEQTVMKARFSMKDDKQTLAEIEAYAKKIGI